MLKRRFSQESLAKKTLLKIGSWVTLIVVLSSIIVYLFIEDNLKAQQLSRLENHVLERVERENESFALAHQNQTQFKQNLIERLQSPSWIQQLFNGHILSVPNYQDIDLTGAIDLPEVADTESVFDHLFTRYPDGVIRNRTALFNTDKQSCLYVDQSASLTVELKQQILLFYELVTAYGRAWRNRFINTYLTLDSVIEVLYWPNYSVLCHNTTRYSDTRQSEYFWVTDPQYNPTHRQMWSGSYYDNSSNTWAISAMTPIDFQGKHFLIGNDVNLNPLLERLLKQNLPETYTTIFREDGRLIAHPYWMNKLRDKKGLFNILIDGDEALKQLFHLVRSVNLDANTHVQVIKNTIDNSHLIVAKMSATGWYFVTVVSNTVFTELAWKTAKFIFFIGVFLLVSVLILLYTVIDGQINKPLHQLLLATQKIGESDFNVKINYQPKDELGRLADSLTAMAQILADRETQLVDYANQLEAHTSELVKAKELAETANRIKSQFIANMSHELRTPLNAIIGYSEMLQEDARDLEEEGFVNDLEKIHAAGKHLLGLINDVLDISKIEAGKMEIYNETFDVLSMLEEVVTTVQPLVEKQNNIIVAEYGERLGQMFTDLTKIRQSLLNLLSNAAKFTENGTITLRAHREVLENDEWIIFQVSDSGIGMTERQQEKLFQAFTQADASTTRKYGGTGLGLVITKRFIEMMGGSISVQSEYGKGSTFTLRLLTTTAALRNTANEETVENDENELRRKILVIDDDPSVRDLLRTYLSKIGYQVAVASGGDEGLRLAHKLRPDAITLDVMMPGMDGWMVLSALKTDPQLVNIPVVMVSIIEDKHLGYSLGASDYLVKPVNREQLKAVLDKYRASNQSPLVMIVEDDPTTQQMMEAMLTKSGWRVCKAGNGCIGLQRVAQCIPDLILLDLMMPEMDGFEFVIRLRENVEWRKIPVVVLTAKDITQEDRLRLNNYAQIIFQKGAYDRDRLLTEIHDLLERSCIGNHSS